MFKRVLSLILCVCLIFTACSKKTATDENDKPIQKNMPAEDKFELTALKSDMQGIESAAGFQLTSKEDINKKYVNDNLQIVPEEKFKIEEISSKLYNIIPLSQFDNDKIYQVKLDDEGYSYSWAFQTKKKLGIESTIPEDGSSYVPFDSGIEMYFNLKELDDIDGFFEISPRVEGRFVKNDGLIVFVPEKLEKNTIYTVTVKKGFGLKDGTQKLEEDYVFTFGTQQDKSPYLYFDKPIINIYEGNVKAVGVYVEEETEYNINIYQYKGSDEFADDVYKYAETGKFPAEEEIEELPLINGLKQKPFMNDMTGYRNALFELPEDLAKGYYLLEFYADAAAGKQYLFMQINDILFYEALFEDQVLIFACDAKTSRGIERAEVVVNGESIGRTDEGGTFVWDKDTSELKALNMRVKAGGHNDFIYAESLYEKYYYKNSNSTDNKYFTYIDTDRPVYLPTDTIHVWGLARHRDYGAVSQVKIELVEMGTGIVLDSRQVKLTDAGTYEAEFGINSITSESLRIKVYDNGTQISTGYVSVMEYTKPLYTVEGSPDKKFAYSGESVNYKINANFFDGYPVPSLELKLNTHAYEVDYEDMDEVVTLNESGEKTVGINTSVRSSGWRPVGVSIDCYNNKAEDTPVTARSTLMVFPKHKMLEIEQDGDEPDSVNILFHELDTSGYDLEENYYSDYSRLRGEALDGVISVKIVESYYEKIKVGEYYDFINKVNMAKYEYNRVENTVLDEMNVNVTSGSAIVKIPNYNSERSYRVTAYYNDGSGGISEESYVYSQGYSYREEYYSLVREGDKDAYRLGDAVNLQLEYGDKKVENIENDTLFVMYMRNGLIDHTVSDSTYIHTGFKEEYIPNVNFNGIYVKNGYIYPVSYTRERLDYDRSERQLNLDISTDKEEYGPGEEASLKVRVTDENNAPVTADVNISVVDEAYFAMFEKSTNTLEDIYSYTRNSGLLKTYVSNIDLSQNESNAEMGGGGGDDSIFRDDFEDTALFKAITTGKDGKGEVKFKLADNLTSWRITCQAVSDKVYAGSRIKNITTSLPFYVDMILGKQYLKEDKINVSLRAFGRDVKESATVEYKALVENTEDGKKTEYAASGSAGDYVNIDLDKLAAGSYEISVSGEWVGMKDGIREEFTVVDSAVYFNNTDYYSLSEETVLKEVYSNPVITLFNESTSDFYGSLNSISSGSGNRIDQSVCSMLAAKYINDNFEGKLYYNEEEALEQIDKYESEDGGFTLLPYSGPDAELTAKLAHTVNNGYLEGKMKVYFKKILDSEEYSTDVAAALWGLSRYGEPVLLTIYDLLENQGLEAGDKIYLSLALAELGDEKTAKKYYREFAGELKESGDYLYYEAADSQQDSYELTSLLAILGVKLKDFETGDKLFRYIYNNPSDYTLSNFEQLIYIMERDIMQLEEIRDLFGEITVDAGGAKKTYELKLFDRESFAVKKDEIKDIKFSGIKGRIACKVDALGNRDSLDKNRTDDFSISVDYTLKGTSQKQTAYNHSDVVRVGITPKFSPAVERGSYEITYVIPSGFRYIDAGGDDASWGGVNGQKLTFYFHYDKMSPDYKPVVFYMQAAQKGEYTVDYAVIKEYFDTRLNYVDKSTLSVN